jgi:DNA-binding NarL/FixJ family response regulator
MNVPGAARAQLSALNHDWQVGLYASVAAAEQSFVAALPHVLLLDILSLGVEGIARFRALKARSPALPVILFTSPIPPGLLLQAMMAGASGCLIKPQPAAALLPQLGKVLDGGLALCEKAERLLLEGLRGLWLRHSALRLTWAEQQVMLCLCLHRRNKDCARALRISEATVHAHLARIYKKLNVHNRESAIQVFTQTLHGGGGKMAGRGFGGIRPFLDLFRDWHSALLCYKRA